MNLYILNSDSKDLDEFCVWLINKMQEHISYFINDGQLIRWDAFINSNNILGTDIAIDIKSVLIDATYNLIYKKDSLNNYNIAINPNAVIPETSAKFINIIQLINYGNLQCQPYSVFDDLMNYFADRLEYYYDMYLEGE